LACAIRSAGRNGSDLIKYLFKSKPLCRVSGYQILTPIAAADAVGLLSPHLDPRAGDITAMR
jgi:hypothetical protein